MEVTFQVYGIGARVNFSRTLAVLLFPGFLIFEHDAVAECAVIGVPDDRLGEEVGAAVVLAEGTSVDADVLRAFVKERIAAFKAPRYIWFMDSALPRNASGKFLKPELRNSLDIQDAH